MKKLSILLFIGVLMAFTSFVSCTSDDENDSVKNALLLYQFLLTGQVDSSGDHYARLYKISCGTDFSNCDAIHVTDSSLTDSSKEAVVLVHGWFIDDINADEFPSDEELKDRIVGDGNWKSFFETAEFKFIYSKMDVYAFDYLTNDGIDTNGSRFRKDLDTAFGSLTEKVILYAHSMGGLVTRSAMYDTNEQPAYVKKVISTGTPYHGSPWASPEFHDAVGNGVLSGIVSEAASFFTETEGGSDLRWDNFDDAIPGASNDKLTALNAKTGWNNLWKAYYGDCDYFDSDGDGEICDHLGYDPIYFPNDGYTRDYTAQSTGTADATEDLEPACGIWNDVDDTTYPLSATQAHNPSDCIVPTKSAILMTSDSTATDTFTADDSMYDTIYKVGEFDHFEIKMAHDGVRRQFLLDLGLSATEFKTFYSAL